MHAFLILAASPNTQIIITTHSASIVKELDFTNLRLIAVEGERKTVSTIVPRELPYPSLNEVNYLAFSEISEEYHNELYGFIEAEDQLGAFKVGKPTIPYIKIQNGTPRHMNIILTEYIRHQIHHPENMQNIRFTTDQLKESINLMRDFIQAMPVL